MDLRQSGKFPQEKILSNSLLVAIPFVFVNLCNIHFIYNAILWHMGFFILFSCILIVLKTFKRIMWVLLNINYNCYLNSVAIMILKKEE